MKYGLVDREANSNAEGGGIGQDPEGNVIGLIEGGGS